jgi:hypothetical protein
MSLTELGEDYSLGLMREGKANMPRLPTYDLMKREIILISEPFLGTRSSFRNKIELPSCLESSNPI